MVMTSCPRRPRRAEGDILGDAGCIGVAGIVRLWAAVLEVPDVGAHDDFFNLGGNSLRAIQMLAEIARLTNVELGTRALYENPTPVTLHAQVHASLTGEVRLPLSRTRRRYRVRQETSSGGSARNSAAW
jgi:phosphopantetheine binding protein